MASSWADAPTSPSTVHKCNLVVTCGTGETTQAEEVIAMCAALVSVASGALSVPLAAAILWAWG